MKLNKNKKISYIISSVCAVIILVIGIFVATNDSILKNNTVQIGEEGKENIKVELNINKLREFSMSSLDADIKIVDMKSVPEKYKFMESITVPEDYKIESCYNIYVKGDQSKTEYNVLHDYVFSYSNDSMNKIIISFSEMEEPIRDYYIEDVEKISKIGNLELKISQWEQMYIVTFEYNNLYFDIETTGLTESELVSLLHSIAVELEN